MVGGKRVTGLVAGLVLGLGPGLGLGLGLVLGLSPGQSGGPSLSRPSSPALPDPPVVDASAHLLAAQRQADDDPSATAAFERACPASAAPETAVAAIQQLQAAEAEHQRLRALPRPLPEQLLAGVVARGCAAHHASRLQVGASYPLWMHSRLQITGVRPAAAGIEVQAQVASVDGPVRGIRITFSRGLHHACFTSTDTKGQAVCTMVDTHPHGPGFDGWAEAHEGPIVATLAGSVSPALVQLPAVVMREIPVFAALPHLR